MSNRNQLVRDNFIKCVKIADLPESSVDLSINESGLSKQDVCDIFESQLTSRHLDLQSRVMQKNGQSFYTIGSAGHEGNAACAFAVRASDMAFLHYRSGAFFIQRSKQIDGQTPIYDMLLSFSASRDDVTSGGRHKVLGSKALNIPPQTSTIASHLPKAVGAAYSIGLSSRLGIPAKLPEDSIIVCNFGDASSNHSTAQGAINATAWAAYQSIDMPIVFICEDNGIGISTATPEGWVQANFQHRAGLTYIDCDGLNILDTYVKTRQAAKIAREHKKPVFLHMRTVRILGHAGSDAEFTYRSMSYIEQTEAQDPLLHSAKILLDNDIMSTHEIIALYENIEKRVASVAIHAASKPKLEDAESVKASLIPGAARKLPAAKTVSQSTRESLFSHDKHNLKKPQHMAKLLNWALMDLMAEHDNMIMFGEDVGPKGGVYNVSNKLCERFGKNRVINTLLDEQSILGLAIGLAHNGFIPVPEIQFLAYVHNAEDQIRGEAATLSFFSNAQFTNPMVIRIAGLAYQKGFGGHFHNDNSFAVFRDIPGLIIACPSNGADAVEMMRTSIQLAKQQQRVVVFLEPIALYMTKDLHEQGDGLWTFPYLADSVAVDSSNSEHKNEPASDRLRIKTHGLGSDICIISYGNGYYLSRQAEHTLEENGVTSRIVDLRWLAPLDTTGIIEQAKACKKVLIVDECRQTGSISEALITLLSEHDISAQRICAHDSFIPLGTAAYHVLPSKQDIVEKVLAMFERGQERQESPAQEPERDIELRGSTK